MFCGDTHGRTGSEGRTVHAGVGGWSGAVWGHVVQAHVCAHPRAFPAHTRAYIRTPAHQRRPWWGEVARPGRLVTGPLRLSCAPSSPIGHGPRRAPPWPRSQSPSNDKEILSLRTQPDSPERKPLQCLCAVTGQRVLTPPPLRLGPCPLPFQDRGTEHGSRG